MGALAAACGANPHPPVVPRPDPPPGPLVDAPYDLANDQDLQWVRQQYDALDAGAPARDARRAELAAEYARRIDAHLARGQRDRAYDALVELLGLWTPAEIRDGRVAPLADYAEQIEALRASFFRSGDDERAAVCTVALMAAAPPRAAELTARLDEILAYADDLAVAEHGDAAARAGAIAVLEHVVDAFAHPVAIDRLATLYADRQRAIAALIARGGDPDFHGLFAAHGRGMFRAAWDMARLLVRAGRFDDARRAVDAVHGIGESPPLRAALAGALDADADARAWMSLATAFVSDKEEDSDLDAAFAVCAEGVRRFPDFPMLARMASAIARERSELPLAIAYAERAYRADPTNRDVADDLAELYEARVTRLALSERPVAATRALAALERFHRDAQRRWPRTRLARDLADAYAAMGRGMASLGEIARAKRYLRRSIALRPTLAALELLGTIALKRDDPAGAIAPLARALALPARGEDLFARGRVRRLLGEAYARAGQAARARDQWTLALAQWKALLDNDALRPAGRAEALIETGKLLWLLGEPDAALSAFETAVDTAPQSSSTYADVVAFLIVRDRYADALDAYHRALGRSDVGDYFKTYMSLWVLAEARRAGRAADPNAIAYLSRRDGRLWEDRLARFALGREDYAALSRAATTRGRRAELCYYAAVLGGDANRARATALLQRVVDTGMVLFFEYDMAKVLLERARRMAR